MTTCGSKVTWAQRVADDHVTRRAKLKLLPAVALDLARGAVVVAPVELDHNSFGAPQRRRPSTPSTTGR